MDKAKKYVNRSRNKIVSIFTLSVCFLMCVLVIVGVIVQKVCYVTEQTGINRWEASEYYPLEKENKKIIEYSLVERVSDKIVAVENKIEQKVTSSFYFKIPFVMVKKVCDKALGLDMTTSLCSGENDLNSSSDIVLEYSDGYLGFIMDNVDISDEIEEIVTFGSQMKSEGRNFLFLMLPGKYKGNDIYQDYSKEKMREVIDSFDESGLDIVCLQEMMNKEEFFKTDHHWLPSAGIWADGVLCGNLNEKYGYNFNISVFDMDNYKTEVQEDFF